MIITLDLTDKQIEQLREVMDSLPLRTHAPLIVAVLKALPFPESDAALVHGADASPHAHTGSVSRAGGFSMTAHTPEAVAALEHFQTWLGHMENL